MGDTKNLANTEAIEKLKQLAEDADICHFVTNLKSLPLQSRPMSTQEVDDEGNIWFMSRNTSDKNIDIAMDHHVQLFYSKNTSSEYLSVYGTAEISTDKAKIKELWQPINKAWFTEGEDDPSITLIKVAPLDAYYWDTKDNKFVSLLKIAASALIGREMDGGIEGTLKV
jgi:general stress protein 26